MLRHTVVAHVLRGSDRALPARTIPRIRPRFFLFPHETTSSPCRGGQNPHTPTQHFASPSLRCAAPLRALVLLLSPRGRECSTRISSSRGSSRSARYGESAPFIAPPTPLVTVLIALVSLPVLRSAFGSIPSSDKSRSVFFPCHACADSAATNCVRPFLLRLQDGSDAPLEDQPQAARQARHHQNLVRKVARAIRVPPCCEGNFFCAFLFLLIFVCVFLV